MFAQWADDIFRKFIAFIDISADFAYPAFFAFSLWLRFYVFLVVGVSHGILIAHNTGLCDAADEHSVSAKIYVLLPDWNPNCSKTENGASVDRQFTFMIPVCWITW